MILFEGNELVFQPKTNSTLTQKRYQIESGHACPVCRNVIDAVVVLEDERAWDQPHHYSQPNGVHRHQQLSYSSSRIRLKNGFAGIHFRDTHHYSKEPTLLAAARETSWGNCQYVKAIFEVSPQRRLQRFVHQARTVTYDIPSPWWKALSERHSVSPEVASECLERLAEFYKTSPDICGKTAPVILLNRSDFYKPPLRRTVESLAGV